MSIASLAERISRVQGGVQPIVKDQRGTLSYNFASVEQIKAMIRPLFVFHGLAFWAEVADASFVERTTKSGAVMSYARVKMRFHLACTHTGEEIVAEWYSEASDTGDKAINKAATAGTKYFLINTFLLSTDEDIDPDQFASEEHLPKCEDCKAEILPSDKATAPQLATLTNKHFGRALCQSCYVKAKEAAKAT